MKTTWRKLAILKVSVISAVLASASALGAEIGSFDRHTRTSFEALSSAEKSVYTFGGTRKWGIEYPLYMCAGLNLWMGQLWDGYCQVVASNGKVYYVQDYYALRKPSPGAQHVWENYTDYRGFKVGNLQNAVTSGMTDGDDYQYFCRWVHFTYPDGSKAYSVGRLGRTQHCTSNSGSNVTGSGNNVQVLKLKYNP